MLPGYLMRFGNVLIWEVRIKGAFLSDFVISIRLPVHQAVLNVCAFLERENCRNTRSVRYFTGLG